MKKLLVLLFLMTISLGQSQSLKLGFEAGESGNAFGQFGDIALPSVVTGTGSNTSNVLSVIANPAGQPWQGFNFLLTSPVELIGTKTMTIDVLSSQPVTFLLKVNGGVAGAPEAAAQASHNGDGTWQTISFTFNTALDGKAAQANGVYNNMVLHPFFPFTGASTRSFFIDNISGPDVSPTLSNFSVAPKLVGAEPFELTAPTTNSAGAFTYTSGNTSVATISGTTVTVVGAGTSTITATQAANGSYGAGSITAAFIVTSAPLPTIGALTLPSNKVTGDASFSLTDPTSNSAGAFTYTSSNTAVATISGSTVTIVGLGSSTITATQAATASYDSGSVTATLTIGEPKTNLLGFETGETGAATGQFGGFAAPTVVTGTGANTSSVLNITTNGGGQIWQGTNFVLTRPVKLTDTKTMTVDVLSDTPITFLMKVNGGVAGAAEAAAQASHNGDGTWQTVSFTFNTSLDGKAAQANGVYNNMVLHPFFPFSGSPSTKTFYIDNINGPLALIAPTLSNFAISAKSVGNSFELTAPTTNSDGAFTYTSSNEAVATISGTTVSVVGAGNVTITATQAAGTYNTSGTITATFTASNLIIPTIGALTVPAKEVGAAAFDLTAPSSDSAGAFTYTSSNTAVATISGSTVTVVGVGTSTITAAQAASGSYDAGSVTATLTVTIPSAPTPTNAAEDVISVFSNAYTDLANTSFFPNWGQSTQYVQENGMLKYSNLNYQGITFASPINGAAMEKLHIDIWTPNCTSFQMFVLDGSAPEQNVTLTPSFNGWNSYDIDLAQYTSLTKSNLVEFKIVGNGTVYLDNIFFWKLPAGTFTYYADADGDGYGAGAASLSTATTAPTGFSVNNTDCNDANAAVNPGATEVLNSIDDDCDGLVDDGVLPTIPTTDAPTAPARNAWDVQSVYSSAYTNYSGVNFFPNWGQSTTFSNYTPVSDETLKYSNLTYQGIDFNGSKNISAMTKLHLDVWTPDMSSFKVFLIAGGESAVTLTPTQSGWNSYDLDLATEYAGRNLTAAVQLKLERTLWTPTDGNVNSLYLDNIYFYRPATTQPPTIGAFTVPAKVVGDASFDLTAPTSNGSGAFSYTSSNTAVATISGATVTIVGAGSSTITATQAADATYSSASVTATLVVSLATAAPTPPARNAWDVKSIFSGAYTDVAGTNFFPNWGQATQYAQVEVVGDPTLRYSNLGYQGVQLASPIDVNAFTTLHIDVYGAGTSAVNFFVINQEGMAGSGIQKIEVNTPLTLNPGWNSFDIALSSLTGLELNRVGQFMFTGSGTIYVDNLYFYRAATGTTFYADADGDGYGAGSTVAFDPLTVGVPSGYSATNDDCDDANDAINPAATEVFDTIDNDCDGSTDEGTTLGAPVVTNTSMCKGALGVSPSATALPGYTLVWYSSATGTTPLTATPVITATKTFHVAQRLGTTGPISARAAVTVTVNNLPATPSVLASLEAKNICKYIGSSTPVTFTATATGASSYIWTAPEGAVIVNDGAQAFISFENVSATPGLIGSVTVKIEDANGCISVAKALTLTTVLPKAPTALTLTSADTAAHFKGIITPADPTAVPPTPAVTGLVGLNSLVKITKVGPYMGTDTVFTLTAPEAITAASYVWTLPTGVNQLSGGTSNVITVDFADVEPGIGSLPIVVQSVGGCGNSINRTLTLARALPSAPTKLVLTDDAISTTTAVTKVGPYTGKSTALTLTATPFTTQGGTATSYAWILPAGVNCVTSNTPTTVKVKSTVNTGTVEAPIYAIDDVVAIATASSTITINFDDVESGVTSLPIQVFGVNGAGNSIARTLALTAAAPATPAIVGSAGTGTSTQFSNCLTKIYTATLIPGATYAWTVPAGATIVGDNDGNVIEVDYSTTTVAIGASGAAVTCTASNGTGNSITKSLTVKRVACPARIAPEAATAAEAFKAVAYPNPSTEGFRIKSSNGKSFGVQVYDMLGRSIEQRQMSSDAQIGSNYAKGIYNVIVNQGANVKTLRVIKQ